MINNSEQSNIKLTDEQALQLEQYEIKLANLLSEITNATKILKGTKLESDRAVSARAYQEELLAELTPKVEEKRKQFDAFNEEINKATSELAKLQEEIRTKTADQAEKDAEYENRENKILAEELRLGEKDNRLTKIAFALDNEKKEFDGKVAKLKEVIKDF